MLTRIAFISFPLFLSGCGFVHEETLVARYKLVAVDIQQDMSLCWSLDSGDCVGDGLPGPTVFAAGYDDKYVVAAVHPDQADKKVTQFFYVVRDPRNENTNLGLRYAEIKGPFSESQYETEKSRLRLPDFSRTFAQLK